MNSHPQLDGKGQSSIGELCDEAFDCAVQVMESWWRKILGRIALNRHRMLYYVQWALRVTHIIRELIRIYLGWLPFRFGIRVYCLLDRHTNTHIKCGSTGCVDRVVIDEHKQAKYLVIITMYAMRVCLVAANNTGSGQVLCQAIRTSTKTVQDNDYYRNTATFRHLMCVYTTRLKLSHLNCNLYQDDTPRTHARAINYI